MSLRIEEKHVSRSLISYTKALQNLKLNGNVRRHHPSRVVASVYYDTSDFALAYASLRGDSRRVKVRSRTYFSSNPSYKNFRDANYSVEVKLKEGRIGDKKHLQKLNWEQVFTPIDIKLSSTQLFGLRPSCCVVYSRDYFIEIITGTRITIDKNIRVYHFKSPDCGLVDLAKSNNLTVIEVKRSADAYGQPFGLSNRLNFSRSRFSKYLYALHMRKTLEYIF